MGFKKRPAVADVVAGVADIVESNTARSESTKIEKRSQEPSAFSTAVSSKNDSKNVTGADLLNPIVEEKRTEAIYLRCKPSVRAKFEKLCEEKGISQANMFEHWVQSLLQ